MGTRTRDIFSFMEKLAPSFLAESWDNTGLMLGGRDRDIQKVLLCLDVTAEVVEEAINNETELIISHHPFIFKKFNRIKEEDIKGSLVYRLIKADIDVFSAHTNLDVVECGVNRKLAEKLNLKEITPLKNGIETTDEGKPGCNQNTGLGNVGLLDTPVELDEFINMVKRNLEVSHVRVVGSVKRKIHRAAVFCGSFDDDLSAVISQKADVLVTGDLKYHTAVDAIAMGMCIIDAGHFNTEKIVLPHIKALLENEFPSLQVLCSRSASDPFITY